jgi:hypothetical protein
MPSVLTWKMESGSIFYSLHENHNNPNLKNCLDIIFGLDNMWGLHIITPDMCACPVMQDERKYLIIYPGSALIH